MIPVGPCRSGKDDGGFPKDIGRPLTRRHAAVTARHGGMCPAGRQGEGAMRRSQAWPEHRNGSPASRIGIHR